MKGCGKNLLFSADVALPKRDRWCPLVSTSKTLYIFSRQAYGALWRLILFYCVYESLAYDGGPLLNVPLCVSKAFLVYEQ